MDNKSEENIIFKKLYKKYKPILDKKLSRIILNLFDKYKINYKAIYIITIGRKYKVIKDIYDISERHKLDKLRHDYNRLFTPYGDTIMPLCGCNSHI
jgi:hypothetical protein